MWFLVTILAISTFNAWYWYRTGLHDGRKQSGR